MSSSRSHCPGEASVLASATQVIRTVNSWVPGKLLAVKNGCYLRLLKRWLLLIALKMQNTATILQVVCTIAVTASSSRGQLCSVISLSVEEQEKDPKEQGTINSKQGKERRGRTSATPNWNFSLASLSFTLYQHAALIGQDRELFLVYRMGTHCMYMAVTSWKLIKKNPLDEERTERRGADLKF